MNVMEYCCIIVTHYSIVVITYVALCRVAFPGFFNIGVNVEKGISDKLMKILR